MKRVLWTIVLLSLLGCTAWADGVRHDQHRREHREWAQHRQHERDRREWRGHHHEHGYRNADGRPPGWNHGQKRGWRDNDVPPGLAKK